MASRNLIKFSLGLTYKTINDSQDKVLMEKKTDEKTIKMYKYLLLLLHIS